MQSAVINLGGEDYSVEFLDSNGIEIYSVQNNGREIDFGLDADFENDLIDKIIDLWF